MERWAGKVALVTGSASGIGRAITLALLKKQIIVVGLDICNEESPETADNAENRKSGYYPLRCDVVLEKDIDAVFSFVEQKLGGVDIMVNNAGVINYEKTIESDRKAFEKLLNINVLAVAVCINRAVRSMRERNVEGHVFNINSVIGHEIPGIPPLGPGTEDISWNLYSACKHGTVALTHTVRRELRVIKAPIRITSISPGVVKTRLAKGNQRVEDLMRNMPMLLPQDIADALVYVLGTRPEVQITELTIRHIEEP